jgi:hypothetical protein
MKSVNRPFFLTFPKCQVLILMQGLNEVVKGRINGNKKDKGEQRAYKGDDIKRILLYS